MTPLSAWRPRGAFPPPCYPSVHPCRAGDVRGQEGDISQPQPYFSLRYLVGFTETERCCDESNFSFLKLDMVMFCQVFYRHLFFSEF